MPVKPHLNVSSFAALQFTDGSTLTTDTSPNLGSLPGQLNENQMPATLGAGSSLTNIDAGTY